MPSMPAARLTDMHTCAMFTGPVPHVGGPIIAPCAPTVLIGSLPAARVTDPCVCAGPPDVIVMGAFTTLIMKMPAARIGDMTAHGGVIVTGMPTVIIGDAPPGSPAAAAGQASASATSKSLVDKQNADYEEQERKKREDEERASQGLPPNP